MSLFTLIEEFQRGANQIFETVPRFMSFCKGWNGLPRTLFIQAEMFYKRKQELKYTYVLRKLSLLECFDKVKALFIPTGHTHEDID